MTLYHRERGTDPTIIFNFKNFTKILSQIDEISPIYGGRYNVYNEKIKHFFAELKACNANLVFFCRPYFKDEMMKEEIIREAFDRCAQGKFDQYRQHVFRTAITYPWHMDKRILYNLMKIAAEFGTVITEYRRVTARCVEYATEHADDILAMIQHDTDFLLFDGKYQYWSLIHLDMSNLTIQKYCRDALYREFGLENTAQAQLFAALTMLEFNELGNLCKNPIGTKKYDLHAIADYARQQEMTLNDGYDLEKIAIHIFGENYQPAQLQRLKNHLAVYMYTPMNDFDVCDPKILKVAKFCKENLYFVYGLIIDPFTSCQGLAFIDLRRQNATEYVTLVINVLLKLFGILYKDFGAEERPKTRPIQIKRTIEEDSLSKCDENIIYPTSRWSFLLNIFE